MQVSKEKGLSKTAFIGIVLIIIFGLTITTILSIIADYKVGAFITGGLIFGALTIGLMIMLNENDYKLTDDFKVIFVKKHILPDGEEEIEEEKEDEYLIKG